MRTLDGLIARLGRDDPRLRDVDRRMAFERMHRGELDLAAVAIAELAAGAGSDPAAAVEVLALGHWHADCSGDRASCRHIHRRAEQMVQSDVPVAARSRAAGITIIEALHHGDLDAVRATASQIAGEADAAGEPHAGWLARAALFTPAFLDEDLTAARAAADAALTHGTQHRLAETRGTYATHQFALRLDPRRPGVVRPAVGAARRHQLHRVARRARVGARPRRPGGRGR